MTPTEEPERSDLPADQENPGPAGDPKRTKHPDLSAETQEELLENRAPEVKGPLAGQPLANPRTLLLLTIAVVVAAILTGFVGGAFRWCLMHALTLRDHLATWAHQWPAVGWLLPVLIAAAGAAIGRSLVRVVPRASGSGIQDVEAVWRGQKELPRGPGIIIGKFLGGLATIGPGMVLGREGPTVHMGSTIGSEIGRLFGVSEKDRKVLYAAVGGAGLAVAFNAPIGGAMFALEEVTKTFRMRVVLITIFASSVAVGCARLVYGIAPDFSVPPVPMPSVGSLWVFVIFGALTGLVGSGYNWLIMFFLHRVDALVKRMPPEIPAAVIGAIIGLLLWLDPLMVGGGDSITQLILHGQRFGVWVILGYLAIRFVAGPLSYSAATPGGLFAPQLAMGAAWGTLCFTVAGPLLGEVGHSALPLALVGMTAFFTASVRAPLTGVTLICEMTATTSLTAPMLVACAASFLVAEAVKCAPIYDSLRERMLLADAAEARRRAA